MTKQQRNTSGLKPFERGYDPRREGNGRKPYADLREAIQASITTDDIVKVLKDQIEKGNIKALQELFKLCGLNNTSVLQIQSTGSEGDITLRTTVCGDEGHAEEVREAFDDRLKENRNWAAYARSGFGRKAQVTGDDDDDGQE